VHGGCLVLVSSDWERFCRQHIITHCPRSGPPARYDEGMKQGRRLTIGMGVLAGIAALMLLYAFAYLNSWEDKLEHDTEVGFTMRGRIGVQLRRVRFEPHYRIGSSVIEYFFAPAHAIDRWLRPEYWPSDRTYEESHVYGETP